MLRFPELSKYVNEELSWPLDLRTDAKVPHSMHEITSENLVWWGVFGTAFRMVPGSIIACCFYPQIE